MRRATDFTDTEIMAGLPSSDLISNLTDQGHFKESEFCAFHPLLSIGNTSLAISCQVLEDQGLFDVPF
nr:hypothetical protein Iba_chr14dCG17220 [Ipomoea batatas]